MYLVSNSNNFPFERINRFCSFSGFSSEAVLDILRSTMIYYVHNNCLSWHSKVQKKCDKNKIEKTLDKKKKRSRLSNTFVTDD